MVLEKTLESPLDCEEIYHPILKEVSPEYSLEKTLMLGKIEGGRKRRPQRIRWLDGITDSMDMSLGSQS